ncbi:MAG: hypothetical protein HKP37_11880, partial [Boseongicola sp.]|nr:hypothetical protein [Boseongicola sp.]
MPGCQGDQNAAHPVLPSVLARAFGSGRGPPGDGGRKRVGIVRQGVSAPCNVQIRAQKEQVSSVKRAEPFVCKNDRPDRGAAAANGLGERLHVLGAVAKAQGRILSARQVENRLAGADPGVRHADARPG